MSATIIVGVDASLAAITKARSIAAWVRRVGMLSQTDLKPLQTIAKVDTVEGFQAAMAVAKKGDGIVYHTGWLMKDRLYDGILRHVAGEAMRAEQAKQVYLVQRRIDVMTFEYIAIKRGY